MQHIRWLAEQIVFTSPHFPGQYRHVAQQQLPGVERCGDNLKGSVMKISVACVMMLMCGQALASESATLATNASEVAAEAMKVEANTQAMHDEHPHEPRRGMFVHARPLGTASLHVSHRLRDADVGLNGRPWISEPIVNRPGHDGPRVENRSCDEPGAARYGALGDELRTAYVRVNTLRIGISPWQRIEPRGLKHLEAARNKWLADRGYTGGVRTVRNDALLMQHDAAHEQAMADEAQSSELQNTQLQTSAPVKPQSIEPRATFRVNPEVTKFKKRMQVQSPFGTGNLVFASTPCAKATVGPSVATVRGESGAGVTMVLPAGTSAASIVQAQAAPQEQPAKEVAQSTQVASAAK